LNALPVSSLHLFFEGLFVFIDKALKKKYNDINSVWVRKYVTATRVTVVVMAHDLQVDPVPAIFCLTGTARDVWCIWE